MPFRRFMVYNGAGALGASIFDALLGYEFGHDLPALQRHIIAATMAVGSIALVVAATWPSLSTSIT